MANIRSALKRIRQNTGRTAANKAIRTRLKTARKAAQTALESGNKEEAQAKMRLAISFADKAAKTSVIHKNAAGRIKRQLAALIR
ncbi:MAG: 30S ribosomal protein S20 [Verrucomicrobiales bacterium]